jgi:hypothetical protein
MSSTEMLTANSAVLHGHHSKTPTCMEAWQIQQVPQLIVRRLVLPVRHVRVLTGTPTLKLSINVGCLEMVSGTMDQQMELHITLLTETLTAILVALG